MPDTWKLAPIMYQKILEAGVPKFRAFQMTCEVINEHIAARREEELAIKVNNGAENGKQ